MARSPTNSDAFNAVAEPQRRRILTLLARGEQSVNCVAQSLKCNQPQVSKHLKVLKDVGLVSVRTCGKQRLYKLEGGGLKTIHDWVKGFESFWAESFDRLEEYLAEIQKADNTKTRVVGDLAEREMLRVAANFFQGDAS